MNEPLGMIFDSRTGALLYSGFNQKEQYAHYNEDPRNRLYIIHALYYNSEQCDKDPGIHTEIKNKEIKNAIDHTIKNQLANNLLVIEDLC